MNKIYMIAGVLICTWICTSCDKFLELTPRDTKVVSTIEDYRDILASYVKFIKTSNPSQEKIMGINTWCFPKFDVANNLGIYTGETTMNTKYSSNYDNKKNEYTTSAKSLLTWLNTDSYVWDRYYQFLGGINLVISGIRTAEGTNEDIRNYVLGEALVWRAYSYFKLLQYYSPYKENAYGIPVYLKSYEDVGTAMPSRNTQKEVFKQILGDCREAAELMDITASNSWNCAWRSDFLNAMMASIYTWKAMSAAAEDTDWESAEKCATEAMRGRRLSNSPEELKQMFDCKRVTGETSMTSDEFYFRLMDGSNGNLFSFPEAYYEGYTVTGAVNPWYYNQFKENDIRRNIYFTEDGTRSNKYNMLGVSEDASGGCLIPFRLAEMYLIKAEALVRQGKTGESKSVMEDFVSARYTGLVALPSDGQQLLQEILDERLREFYMENDFRWLDMKRLGINYSRTINGEKYVLESDDFRYSFPIPRNEMQLNKNMVQTPGWENIVLN